MAFTNRVFATFLAARTVDLLGTALTPVVLTLVALEETKSASATGVVLAANVLPMLVFMLAGGVLADTFPRSRILTATAAASAATQAAMAGLLFSDAFSLGAMAALSAASGILAAFSGPALRGIVPDLVAPGGASSGPTPHWPPRRTPPGFLGPRSPAYSSRSSAGVGPSSPTPSPPFSPRFCLRAYHG